MLVGGEGWSPPARGRDKQLDNVDFSSRVYSDGNGMQPWAQASSNRSKSQPNVAPQTACFCLAHPEEADESVELLLQRGSFSGQGQPVVPAGHGVGPH